MQKINFQNLPSTTTPINATNLNAIQTNVEDVFNGNVAMGGINVSSITSTGDATINGKLYTSNQGREDYAAFGFYYDGSGNMTHKRNDTGDYFSINNYAGNNKVKIYPENGDVQIISNGTNSNVMFMHSGMPSTDLNDIKWYGSYYYDNGSQGYANCPTSDGIHILNVFSNGGTDWVIQEDYVMRWGSSTTEKYIRIYTPGGWSNWQRII